MLRSLRALALLGLSFISASALAAGIAPTSSQTLTSSTTAYTAGQLIANSSTAGSITVSSFSLTNLSNAFTAITRGRLQIADTTSTAWPAATITVDLWSAAPTFNNGDRGTFSVATGTLYHLGALTCTMSASYSDGYWGECSPTIGNFISLSLVTSSPIYWTATATSGSGITGASKVMYFTPEIVN